MTSTTKQELSKYRINKFTAFFRFVDVNRDGYIGADDYEMIGENMARLSNATAEQAADIRLEMLNCWGFISGGRGREHKLTMTEALEGVIRFHSTTDQAKLIQVNEEFYKKVFDIFDRNKDDMISREELDIFYKSHGVPDETFIQSVFDLMDVNKNGVISRDEFVTANTAFWCSDDPENGFAFIYNPPKENNWQ